VRNRPDVIKSTRFWYWVTLAVALAPFLVAVMFNAANMLAAAYGSKPSPLTFDGLKLDDIFGHGDLVLIAITTSAVALLSLVAAGSTGSKGVTVVLTGGGLLFFLVLLVVIWSAWRTAPPNQTFYALASAAALVTSRDVV
jgi:hypothetical protein